MTAYTCPDCGATMRRQRNSGRYVCSQAEAGRGNRSANDPHAYVRAWSIDELDPRARPLPMTGTDSHEFGEE